MAIKVIKRHDGTCEAVTVHIGELKQGQIAYEVVAGSPRYLKCIKSNGIDTVVEHIDYHNPAYLGYVHTIQAGATGDKVTLLPPGESIQIELSND